MKKIISYSLYGSQPKYTVNMVINCLLAQKIYPDWITRVYVDDTVPLSTERVLRTFPWIEIVGMPRHKGSEAMLWRFLPAAEEDTIMISRDADSWLSMREKVCVDEWLKSGKDFHIIRDHCYHSQKIMGGMWGVKSGTLPNMKEDAETFCKNGTYDQGFLADKIYPKIINNVISHYGNPQYNNKGEIVNGYFNDNCVPIPEHEEWDEPVPGISFREANKLNAFHCSHCGKTHDFLIGGITETIPPRALSVAKKYAEDNGLRLV